VWRRFLCWLRGHWPKEPLAPGWQTCQRCRRPFKYLLQLPILRAASKDVFHVYCSKCDPKAERGWMHLWDCPGKG
jgi:hypothetical protein